MKIPKSLVYFAGTEQIKLPEHFIYEMGHTGNLKHIALFASLKKLYPDGFIPNFRKVKLTDLGYYVSKKTYYLYLRKLEKLKLVKGNGKGGCFLMGQKQILELYPHHNPKYIYLENNKELKDNLEFIVLSKNIENQHFKQKVFSQAHVLCKRKNKNPQMIIKKRANGERKDCYTELELETSISCKKQAEIIGYRSPMTGLKRRRKLVAKGFIETTKRCIKHENISRDVAEEYQRTKKWIMKLHNGTWFRILANEIFIIKKIGEKTQCL
jgi:hypothetical protein